MNAHAQPAMADTTAVYQPHVDGLRAVSILVVVFYHAGLSWLPGGFVGVDVFFVISGYLIIGQIVSGIQAGRFSLWDFWARRSWRILPPFLLVLAACWVAASFLLVLPAEFDDFGKQTANAALMVINHLFLARQGYFDTTSETTLLLHMWSLAVEEQFYVAAPLLVAGLWIGTRRLRPDLDPMRVLAVFAAVLFILSLEGAILWSALPGGRNYGFYLTPLRAWEFIAGGAIPVLLPYVARLGQGARCIIGTLGLGAILAAALLFSSEDVYPGWRAAIPVGGAVAVILAGLAGSQAGAIRFLASRPMVAIGLVSYAWYLWHWPLLAFARIRLFGDLDLWLGLLLSAVALLLATATYLFVERPIRRLRQTGRVRLGWRPVAVGVTACVALAIAGRQGMAEFSRQAGDYLPVAYQPRPGNLMPVCDLKHTPTAEACLEQAVGKPLTLVIGDSFVMLPRDAYVQAAAAHGSYLMAAASASCGASFGNDMAPRDPQLLDACMTMRERLQEVLAGLAEHNAPPRTVIINSFWVHYLSGGATQPDQPLTPTEVDMMESLRTTIERLRAVGAGRIVLVGPPPGYGRSPPSCLALADRMRFDRTTYCGIRRAEVAHRLGRLPSMLEEVAAAFSDVRVIEAVDQFCDEEWCRPWDGDEILWSDELHLSATGLGRVFSAHADVIDWLYDQGDD